MLYTFATVGRVVFFEEVNPIALDMRLLELSDDAVSITTFRANLLSLDPFCYEGYKTLLVAGLSVRLRRSHSCQPLSRCVCAEEPAMANDDPGAAGKAATATAPAKKAVERGNSFLEKVVDAAENLINLKIVTVVGEAKLSGTLERPTVEFTSDDGEAEHFVIATNINIVDSDISTVIPKKYESDIGGAIIKYHTERVSQATETMNQRIEFIKSLVEDIVPIIRGDNQ